MAVRVSKSSIVLATALICSGVSACSPGVSPSEKVATISASTEVQNQDAHSGHNNMETLPVEKRVAFMSGHVEAGLALYRAGAPDQAAKHLLHPVSETHQTERAGIDALGFEQTIFISVSEALDAGKPADEVEPQLVAAEANMALMQANAGGDASDIILYLMDVIDEEYAIGVKNGIITDPGEYQDAFGFAVVADKTAKTSDNYTYRLGQSLEELLALWPDAGPLASSTPTPVTEILKATEAVRASLQSE